MFYHWYDIALLVASQFGTAALVVVLLIKRQHRRWPFLFYIMIFDFVLNFALPVTSKSYDTYFYLYWCGAGIRSFISLGLLHDCILAIPGIRFMPREIGTLFAVLCIVVALGSFGLTFDFQTGHYDLVKNVLMLNSCATTAWGGFAITLLGCLSFIGIAWPRLPLNIMSGILINALSSMLTAHAIVKWPSLSSRFDITNNMVYIAILFSWVNSFSTHVASQCGFDKTISPATESMPV